MATTPSDEPTIMQRSDGSKAIEVTSAELDPRHVPRSAPLSVSTTESVLPCASTSSPWRRETRAALSGAASSPVSSRGR